MYRLQTCVHKVLLHKVLLHKTPWLTAAKVRHFPSHASIEFAFCNFLQLVDLEWIDSGLTGCPLNSPHNSVLSLLCHITHSKIKITRLSKDDLARTCRGRAAETKMYVYEDMKRASFQHASQIRKKELLYYRKRSPDTKRPVESHKTIHWNQRHSSIKSHTADIIYVGHKLTVFKPPAHEAWFVRSIVQKSQLRVYASHDAEDSTFSLVSELKLSTS